MIFRTDVFPNRARFFSALVFLVPSLALAEDAQSPSGARRGEFDSSAFVNCDAGDTIGHALTALKSGDTLFVTGTCRENVEISAEFEVILLEGGGTATISGPDSSRDTLRLVGQRGVLVRGFLITGGRDGIHTRWVTLGYLLTRRSRNQTGFRLRRV